VKGGGGRAGGGDGGRALGGWPGEKAKRGMCERLDHQKHLLYIWVMLRGLNWVFVGWRNGMLGLLGESGKKSGKIFWKRNGWGRFLGLHGMYAIVCWGGTVMGIETPLSEETR
jgi:hypothetical protein